MAEVQHIENADASFQFTQLFFGSYFVLHPYIKWSLHARCVLTVSGECERTALSFIARACTIVIHRIHSPLASVFPQLEILSPCSPQLLSPARELLPPVPPMDLLPIRLASHSCENYVWAWRIYRFPVAFHRKHFPTELSVIIIVSVSRPLITSGFLRVFAKHACAKRP